MTDKRKTRFSRQDRTGGLKGQSMVGEAVEIEDGALAGHFREMRYKRDKREYRKAKKHAEARAKITLPKLKFMEGDGG